MGRSQEQESDRPDDNGVSDDILLRTIKCEVHIDNHIHQRWRRVTEALYRDISGLRPFSQEADESRRSSGCCFRVATTIETVRQW
jgi:hypothetical protein